MKYTAKTGMICVSESGRDKGRTFIIVGLPEEGYALIADGTMRRLAKPKKKKLKQLHLTGQTLGNIADKLETGQKVFDAEIWSAIGNLEKDSNKGE